MAWAELLRDAVCGKLDLQDAEERERPFYRVLSDKEEKAVLSCVRRLVEWKNWRAPKDDEIDRVLSDNKSAVKDWFKSHGLTMSRLS
jgi:hypothetical protein